MADHQTLKWLFGFREPKGRIAQWIEILAQYQFDVEYRPGKGHGNADGMSRCPNPRECTCMEQDNLEHLTCGPCNKCTKTVVDMQNETMTTGVRRATTNSKDNIDASINSTMYKLFYYILALLFAFRPGSKESFKEAFGIPNLMENHMEKKHKSEFLDDGRKGQN